MNPYGNYIPRASAGIWDLLTAGQRRGGAAASTALIHAFDAIIAAGHPTYGHQCYSKELAARAGYPMGAVRPPLTTFAQLGPRARSGSKRIRRRHRRDRRLPARSACRSVERRSSRRRRSDLPVAVRWPGRRRRGGEHRRGMGHGVRLRGSRGPSLRDRRLPGSRRPAEVEAILDGTLRGAAGRAGGIGVAGPGAHHRAVTLEEAVEGVDYVQECIVRGRRGQAADVRRRWTASPARTSCWPAPARPLRRRGSPPDFHGRERCLVVHPGNPPYFLRVAEIVPAPFTSESDWTAAPRSCVRVRHRPRRHQRGDRGLRLQPSAGRAPA